MALLLLLRLLLGWAALPVLRVLLLHAPMSRTGMQRDAASNALLLLRSPRGHCAAHHASLAPASSSSLTAAVPPVMMGGRFLLQQIIAATTSQATAPPSLRCYE